MTDADEVRKQQLKNQKAKGWFGEHSSKAISRVSGDCGICYSFRFELRKLTAVHGDESVEDLGMYETYYIHCLNCGEFLDLEYIGEDWKTVLLEEVGSAIGFCQDCGARHEVEDPDTNCQCGGEIR
jgi:hypothetical protein